MKFQMLLLILKKLRNEIQIDFLNYNMNLYQKIEHAIIWWNNDGTRTAGSLTREIIKIIEDEKETNDIQKDDINQEDSKS